MDKLQRIYEPRNNLQLTISIFDMQQIVSRRREALNRLIYSQATGPEVPSKLTHFLSRAPTNLNMRPHPLLFQTRNDLSYDMYMLKRRQRFLQRDTQDYYDAVKVMRREHRIRRRKQKEEEQKQKLLDLNTKHAKEERLRTLGSNGIIHLPPIKKNTKMKYVQDTNK